MSNINQERKYRNIASRIEDFMLKLMEDESTDIKLSNPEDKKLFDLMHAAQCRALDLSSSYNDKVLENL